MVSKKQSNYNLTPSARAKLEKAANETGLSKSQVIENLISHYIESFTRKFTA